jgi:type II secretory pathway pseudopilin PulG
LITLGIIGIVAALTMPSLVAKYQEKATATKLKKFYSVMLQAYVQAIAEHGTPDNWGLMGYDSAQGVVNLMNILAPYLKVSKNCGTQPGCAPDVNYKDLNGANNENIATRAYAGTMILADGTYAYFITRSADCTLVRGTSSELRNTCGNLYIDINGEKPPNRYGQDMFWFYLAKNSIIPVGTQGETYWPANANCFKTHGHCASAWVIYNENMDYLHCPDELSWNKTKCD